MPAAVRQFFTVDLRGLRAALSARATRFFLDGADGTSLQPLNLR
jgi:hypothetical protein